MRLPSAVVAAAVGTGALFLSWSAGQHPAGLASDAVVVSAAPAGATAGSSAPPVPVGSDPAPGPVAPAPTSPRAPAPTSAKAPAPPAPPAVGQVTGPVVHTQYGPVQVQVRLSGRTITDVVAVQLTNSSDTSVQISADAAPILRGEALAAQSAKIDIVSGATYTSLGYQQSLQAALDAAHI